MTVCSMMADRPVLFLDSGIGGLNYAAAAREMMPSERFLYVADNSFFPYGEKPSETVVHRVLELTGRCISLFQPKAAVIACNTASVTALSALRDRYDIPFIGVVPAVKPAAEQSISRKIGIFATNRTVGDVYTENLIREFAPDCSIIFYPGAETVTYIEKRFFTDTEAAQAEYIDGIAAQFIADGIDSLVLGCTHFVFIARGLREVLRGKVEVIDSRDGVTRQLTRVLSASGDSPGGAGGGAGSDLYITAAEERNALFPLLAGRFGLEYRGILAAEEMVR